jgi:hypothetical protein
MDNHHAEEAIVHEIATVQESCKASIDHNRHSLCGRVESGNQREARYTRKSPIPQSEITNVQMEKAGKISQIAIAK